ncbi:protein disulfide-isomerase, partial [Clonorchis sinensis]
IREICGKVNSEEVECTKSSANRPRKGDTTGTRTVAHETDGRHDNQYATAPEFDLPKIEIDKFSGNLIEVRKFMKVFQMSVADWHFDDNNKMMYLPHYCRGEAKEGIEHCVFLPGKAGYQMAMNILGMHFGRPQGMAQSFMNELLVGGPSAPRDVNGLRRLIRKMVNCDLALRKMHYTADLNCSTNLMRIVERLPRHLQQRWTEAVDDILSCRSEPKFDHLVSFLDRSVSIALNCYSVIASPERYDNQVDKVGLERLSRKARINVVWSDLTVPRLIAFRAVNIRGKTTWDRTGSDACRSIIINCPDIKDTVTVSFAIQSLHDRYDVDLDCACTTEASIPDALMLRKWAHLADVQPARIPGYIVSILIKTNVSEAYWVIGQR